MPDWGSMAGELVGSLPSWDDISSTAGSVADTVGGLVGGFDPGMVGELMMPGGFGDILPSDFLPGGFDPGMVGELMMPGGFGDILPSDFLPGGFDPGMAGELMGGFGGGGLGDILPSMPDIPWDMAGELRF